MVTPSAAENKGCHPQISRIVTIVWNVKLESETRFQLEWIDLWDCARQSMPRIGRGKIVFLENQSNVIY